MSDTTNDRKHATHWLDNDDNALDPETWFWRMECYYDGPPTGIITFTMRDHRTGECEIARVFSSGSVVRAEEARVDAPNDSLWLDGAWHTGKTEIVKALTRVFGGVS
jgi:hypothetical protein